MTKICGLVSGDPDLRLPEVLDRMYAASWHKGYVRREVWSSGPVGLGHFSLGAVNTEPQPLFSPDRKHAIVYCGKIFDYGHLRRDLEKKGVRFRYPGNDAEFLLHLLRETGTEHLAELNGIFSAALWDAADGSLALTGDRYGFRPMYYYHDAARGVLAFASDLRAVLATGLPALRVNWHAVNTFLHFGHMLGEETLFEGIFRLPPAGILTFSGNEVRLKTHWRLRDLPVRETMPMREAVDGCVDLFRQAIRRRAGQHTGRTIVTLSGGQDSRHIAAELSRQGLGFASYTVSGSVRANEVLASRVARAMSFPHKVVRLPTEGYLTRCWSRAHALVDYETDLHQWILPLVDALPDEPHVNYDGIVGDTGLASVYLKMPDYRLAREGRLDELARGIVGRDHWLPIYHPSVARHLDRKVLYETVRARLAEFEGHPNLLTFNAMAHRTRRAIALFAFKLVAEKAESFYPFADNDYFDFAMSIPPELKLDGRMHRRVLDRAYPELRDIATTKEIDFDEYGGDEADYQRQKRRYLWSGLRDMLRGRPWIYDRRRALPRLLRDLAVVPFKRDHRSFLLNPVNAVLGEWFERYFPGGVD